MVRRIKKANKLLKAFLLLTLNVFLCVFSQHVLAQKFTSTAEIKSQKLFEAIRSGSSDSLQQQLAYGSDANDSLNGYSALMAATLNGSAQQMKILVEHGARVNDSTKTGITALWLAIPDWDKTMLLLDHGADPQHRIEGYSILVKLAMMPGNLQMFQLMVQKGVDPRKSAPDNSLLYEAASAGDTAVLGWLIRNGLDVNDSVSFGDYPLDAGLLFRTFPTVKMLLDHNAKVNIQPMTAFLDPLRGFTPLMFAAWGNDKPSLLYLLDHGADPNVKNKDGYTALMMLAQSETDDPEMTLALITHGAHVSDKTPEGSDALYYAQRRGNTPSVDLLKQYANK